MVLGNSQQTENNYGDQANMGQFNNHGQSLTRGAVAIAVDNSGTSEYAFQWSLDHVLKPTDSVVLLHVRPALKVDPHSDHSKASESSRLTDLTHYNEGQEILDHYSSLLRSRGIRFQTFSLAGKVTEELISKTEQLNASMLIMGSRGHSAFKKAFVGSTSDYCTKNAECPVTVVRHPQKHVLPEYATFWDTKKDRKHVLPATGTSVNHGSYMHSEHTGHLGQHNASGQNQFMTGHQGMGQQNSGQNQGMGQHQSMGQKMANATGMGHNNQGYDQTGNHQGMTGNQNYDNNNPTLGQKVKNAVGMNTNSNTPGSVNQAYPSQVGGTMAGITGTPATGASHNSQAGVNVPGMNHQSSSVAGNNYNRAGQ